MLLPYTRDPVLLHLSKIATVFITPLGLCIGLTRQHVKCVKGRGHKTGLSETYYAAGRCYDRDPERSPRYRMCSRHAPGISSDLLMDRHSLEGIFGTLDLVQKSSFPDRDIFIDML